MVIRWGKSQGKQNVPGTTSAEGTTRFEPVPGLPRALPHPEELEHNFFNLAQSTNPFPTASYSQYAPTYPMQAAPPPANLAPNQAPPPPLPGFLADGPAGINYPSQDPTRLGSINKTRQT